MFLIPVKRNKVLLHVCPEHLGPHPLRKEKNKGVLFGLECIKVVTEDFGEDSIKSYPEHFVQLSLGERLLLCGLLISGSAVIARNCELWFTEVDARGRSKCDRNRGSHSSHSIVVS
uniref:Uncharacterized protein n=1 Tax=Pithovirus LCPAC101 TaxID=2506586 RepID=A0A481Z2T7_9VIRU|nr:MAG: hypothetical protein LCPAC101_00780 [Pithovirus LCPAC101]